MNMHHCEEARIERKSDRELVVTRTVNAPVQRAFEAWARPDLFKRWWAPASFGMVIAAFEADVRTGGTYRLEMGQSGTDQTMTFFGRYLDVVPRECIVWTNDEGGGEGPVTTVTFREDNERTLISVYDLYPSKDALDEAIEEGSTNCWNEQFQQLDALLGEGELHR